MGFLLGITHKPIGDLDGYGGSLRRDRWSYLSNGELTRVGYFLDSSIRLDKHATNIEELSSDEDRKQITIEIKRRLGPYTAADWLVLGAAMVSPVLLVGAAVAHKALEKKREANLPPDEAFACLRVTLKNGKAFTAVATRRTLEALCSNLGMSQNVAHG
jgi:hypothetical protein